MLRIGVSLDRRAVFEELLQPASELLRVPHNESAGVQILYYDDMLAVQKSALEGGCDVIFSDSSIALEQIDESRRDGASGDGLIDEYTVFAASPIVIVMRASRARMLGYPRHNIGWGDMLALASNAEVKFTWSHPTPRCGTGLLALLAIFHAGSHTQGEVRQGDLGSKADLEFVRQLERSIAEYGSSANEVTARAIQNGQWLVDAFVTEEQLALPLLKSNLSDPPVIIYPSEGSYWIEYSLALINRHLSSQIRTVYDELRNYLASADGQARVLANGLHPASAFGSAYFHSVERRTMTRSHVMPVSASAYKSPSPSEYRKAASLFAFVKRHINVYLVVDTSQSMEGPKLSAAKQGLKEFVSRIESSEDHIGIIEFNSTARTLLSIESTSRENPRIGYVIDELHARGQTALMDAVVLALDELQSAYQPDRIHAIVLMTDGEPVPFVSPDPIIKRLEAGMVGERPVTVFCIAYGTDANMGLLKSIASAAGGDVYRGTVANIERTYKNISGFF